MVSNQKKFMSYSKGTSTPLSSWTFFGAEGNAQKSDLEQGLGQSSPTGWSSSVPPPLMMFSMWSQSESEHCGLSFIQRILCFGFFLLMAFISVTLAFFNLPISILKPQRFILPFSFGSMLFLTRYIGRHTF